MHGLARADRADHEQVRLAARVMQVNVLQGPMARGQTRERPGLLPDCCVSHSLTVEPSPTLHKRRDVRDGGRLDKLQALLLVPAPRQRRAPCRE